MDAQILAIGRAGALAAHTSLMSVADEKALAGERALTVLTYHSLDTSGSVVSVSPAVFAEQMATLAALGYRGITLQEAFTHREAFGCWPAWAVVLTFDDGFASTYEHALPVLRWHSFKATIFVISGHVGGYNDWEEPPALLNRRPVLSWAQLAELSAANFEIGAHTRTHPDLRSLSAAQATEEMVSSRIEIEEHLGRAVESFAYPYGGASAIVRQIAEREFRSACTTKLRRATVEPNHLLPRVDAYYLGGRGDLERLVCGELDRYLSLRRFGRSVRSVMSAGLRPGRRIAGLPHHL